MLESDYLIEITKIDGKILTNLHDTSLNLAFALFHLFTSAKQKFAKVKNGLNNNFKPFLLFCSLSMLEQFCSALLNFNQHVTIINYGCYD